MNKPFVVILMAFFSIYVGAHSAIASEKLTLAPYDEMPSNVKDSDFVVQQMYVEEKKDFDTKISHAKNPNPRIPIEKWRKTAPSAYIQKRGIEVEN